MSDDLFASNIRKELQVDSALVLTWIRVSLLNSLLIGMLTYKIV